MGRSSGGNKTFYWDGLGKNGGRKRFIKIVTKQHVFLPKRITYRHTYNYALVFSISWLGLKKHIHSYCTTILTHTDTHTRHLIPCPFRNSNGCFNTSHLAKKKIKTGMISLSFFIFQKIKIVRVTR